MLLGAATALVGACRTLPTYQLEAGAPSATIRLAAGDTAYICSNGSLHALTGSTVPASRPLTVVLHHMYRGTYCVAGARARFVPEPGQTYQFDVQQRQENCFVTIMKVDRAAPLGLVLDQTSLPLTETCSR